LISEITSRSFSTSFGFTLYSVVSVNIELHVWVSAYCVWIHVGSEGSGSFVLSSWIFNLWSFLLFHLSTRLCGTFSLSQKTRTAGHCSAHRYLYRI